jgi:hypothetical protein
MDVHKVLLRLDDAERDVLKLLCASLRVSEYTDDVDDFRRARREERMLTNMNELFHTIIGLSFASSSIPAVLKEHLADSSSNIATFHPLLATAFEVGRRYKRLNPSNMREEYGKMLMLLQDVEVFARRNGGLNMNSLAVPVRSVGQALKKHGIEALASSGTVLDTATAPLSVGSCKSHQLAKKAAFDSLVSDFGGEDAEKRAVVELCLRSIDDHRSHVNSCVQPIAKLQNWLREGFQKPAKGNDISIRQGKDGACFSHPHETHYTYVMESLTLWNIIQRNIFDFWEVVEMDMLSECRGYQIVDTGQGHHRLCSAQRTYSRMQGALAEARAAMGGWVGSSVVHLGDRDVPNALVFIDKYTVIPKMLGPIVQTIETLEDVFDDSREYPYPGVRNLLRSQYASFEDLKQMILRDFFKHAFDGSGDDGGSCIDGRLTSAWNWCSKLAEKPYYNAFVITGFLGFD